MSNFWSKALGTPAPAQQQMPGTSQQPRPWWQQATPPTSAPQQQVVQTIPGSSAYLPTQARSATLTETCPSCQSGNYFKSGMTTMPQCYECGYNPRFDQQAYAAQAGAATAETRQVGNAHLGYNGSIVAHIK